MNNNFLKDEKDFLLNQGINLDLFRKYKWQWLEKEKDILDLNILNNYFTYVLLPYYIINKDLSRSDLKKLGFNPFLVKISHYQFQLSELKDEFRPFSKDNLIKLLGKTIAIRRLKIASQRISNLEKERDEAEKIFFSDVYTYSDDVIKSNKMSNQKKIKWTLSRMYKFNPNLFKNLERNNYSYPNIVSEFLIYFIKNRFRQSYISKILMVDERNLLKKYKKFLNLNFQEAKLEYFSKPIYIKYYSKGMRAYEMIPILSKKYIETKGKIWFI